MKVLVFGTFDQLHPGHLFFLNKAQTHGELTVVIARDVNVKRMKGRLPIQSQVERQGGVQAAFPDAHVILGDSNDFLVPVRDVDPDLIILGYDQELPPGVQKSDFPCPFRRMPPKEPSKYKSSLRRELL